MVRQKIYKHYSIKLYYGKRIWKFAYHGITKSCGDKKSEVQIQTMQIGIIVKACQDHINVLFVENFTQ